MYAQRNIEFIVSIIYVISLLFVFVFFELFYKSMNKKNYCIIFGMIFFALLGFRNLGQGLNDTEGTYHPIFDWVCITEFSKLFDTLYSNYTSPVFIFLFKVLSIISFENYRIALIVISAFVAFSFELFIFHCCKNVKLGNFFFTIFIFPYAFFLLRQIIAMAFISIGLIFVNNKKIIREVVFFILAILIHSSSLAFCLPFFAAQLLVSNFHVKRSVAICLTCIMAGLFIFIPNIFLTMVFNILPRNSKYYNLLSISIYQTGNGWFSMLFANSISLILYLLFANKKDQNYSLYLISVCLFVVFTAFSYVIQDAVRISFYYGIPSMMALSGCSLSESSQNGKLFFTKQSKRYIWNIGCFVMTIYLFVILLPSNNII